MAKSTHSDLSIWWRLYIYALHGYFSEIAFTAAWEYAVTQKPTLMGTTSIWTMPIYGLSGLACEMIYWHTRHTIHMPLLLRGVVYLIWTYLWEFSTGYLLRFFGACPWNYEDYDWDFWGLICLEYAPFWYFGSFIVDQYVIPRVLSLQWNESRRLKKTQ